MYAKKTGESRPQIKVGLPIFLLAKSDQELLESYIRKYRAVARFKNSLQVGRKRWVEKGVRNEWHCRLWRKSLRSYDYPSLLMVMVSRLLQQRQHFGSTFIGSGFCSAVALPHTFAAGDLLSECG